MADLEKSEDTARAVTKDRSSWFENMLNFLLDWVEKGVVISVNGHVVGYAIHYPSRSFLVLRDDHEGSNEKVP